MSDTPRKSLRLSLKRDNDLLPSTPKLEERLHKVLAQAGLGSRRALEQRIADGLVKVNGITATVGLSIKNGDRIEMDGRSFVASALNDVSRILMYNKEEGEITTRDDPEGRPTIFEKLPPLKGARWIAIGRLDINTTGLLLLTTDGELANAMMHPSYEVSREYVCRVRPAEGEDKISDQAIKQLSTGVVLEDGLAKFDEIERIGGTESHEWFRVIVKEGRNREVRRLWESQGCQVSRLKRTRYGDISLPRELLRGYSQEISEDNVIALRKSLNLEDSSPSVLTLQPVIGQRRSARLPQVISRETTRSNHGGGYSQGHQHSSKADEGRELRQFDNYREESGRGGARRHSGLTVSGESAARQAQQRPFKPRTERTERPTGYKGQRPNQGQRPHQGQGNPEALRSWYVPEGVSTGSVGYDSMTSTKPFVKKPGKARIFGRAPVNRDGAAEPRKSTRSPYGNEPRKKRAYAQGEATGARVAGAGFKPRTGVGTGTYTPAAPSFPSDHATPSEINPYYGKPNATRAPRPPAGRTTRGPLGPRKPRGAGGGGGFRRGA